MSATAAQAGSGPISLTLPNFWSALGSRSAFLRWETATELDSPGFYIERADSLTGPHIHPNADPGLSQQPGRLTAADEFVDNVVASHPTTDDSYAIVELHVAPTACYSFIVPIGTGACPVCLPSVDR